MLDGAIGLDATCPQVRAESTLRLTDEDAERIKALLRIHLARDGISASEAKLLRRVGAGDVPNNPSNPEAVALGVLANAELITAARAPQQSPAWVLADDVRYSLLLDD